MNKAFLTTVVIRVLQALAAWFFGFGFINTVPLKSGSEVMVFAAIVGLVVWAIGIGSEYYVLHKTRSPGRALPVTLIGAALGAMVLYIPNVAFGFQGLLIPIIGALSAFHFSGR